MLLATNASLVRADGLNDAVVEAMPSVTEAYTFLHTHPELGKHEIQAHAFLKARLEALGFTDFIESASAPTAVIAVLDTGRPGPVIALRAEMDARPLGPGVNEPADHQPRSGTDGVMHNCGHDAHAAMLLGAAKVLRSRVDSLTGKIVFLFQPAEETPGGADDIVHDKILETLGVTAIFAEHSAPGLPVGTVAVSPGVIMAGSGYFSIKLKGRGSHAAEPSDGDDIGLLAASLALELSNLPARKLDIATRPAVVSITKLIADGGASNVLPSEAELSGTIRAFEVIDQKPVPEQPSLASVLQEVVANFAAAHKISADWTFRHGSPPDTNDSQLFTRITAQLGSVWQGALNTSYSRAMTSEDFAYYSQRLPALYLSLGIAKDELGQAGVHTKDFTIHPDALPLGTRLMSLLGVLATTGRTGL